MISMFLARQRGGSPPWQTQSDRERHCDPGQAGAQTDTPSAQGRTRRLPRDSKEMASGKSGAVHRQTERGDESIMAHGVEDAPRQRLSGLESELTVGRLSAAASAVPFWPVDWRSPGGCPGARTRSRMGGGGASQCLRQTLDPGCRSARERERLNRCAHLQEHGGRSGCRGRWRFPDLRERRRGGRNAHVRPRSADGARPLRPARELREVGGDARSPHPARRPVDGAFPTGT